LQRPHVISPLDQSLNNRLPKKSAPSRDQNSHKLELSKQKTLHVHLASTL